MGAFLAYTVKVAICLLFFYIFNKLILSKDTFHRFNRIVWLLVLGASILLPIFEWKGFDSAFTGAQVYVQEELPVSLLAPDVASGQLGNLSLTMLVKYSLIVYFSLSLILFLKLIFSYLRLFRLIFSKNNHVLQDREYFDLLEEAKQVQGLSMNVNLIVHEKTHPPFSWMSYIVISKSDLEEDGREILIHELSHIRHKHSWDLVIADILIVFQWFNPAAWLYKQSLQEVHEYRADESVLEAGVNAKQYQLLLIKKAVGPRLYSMANSLNHSKLKNRITMMLKEKSNKWALAKCLYALPLAFLAVSAFANPEVSNYFQDISDVEITQNYEENNIKLPLYIVDGKEYSGSIKDLDPESIKSMTVLKGESATDKYGRKGRNGVILITMKDSSEQEALSFDVNGVVIIKYGNTEDTKGLESLAGKVVDVKTIGDTPNAPLIYVNGKEYDEPISDLNPDSIKSMSVLKDEVSIEKYGEKGKNGVILITLKDSLQEREDAAQDKVVPYAFVEIKPKFKGRDPSTAFAKWVGRNLNYPEEAKKKGIQGLVHLRFIINEDGIMGEVKVVEGVDPLLDAEALKVVSSSPKWTPGEDKGKAVKVSYSFPVFFQL